MSKYTREAGVRTLERRIGAVCRAVAVKVAEHTLKSSKMSDQLVKASEANNKDGETAAAEKAETVDVTNIATIPIPPELPIIIDEQAVEDILGVTTNGE